MKKYFVILVSSLIVFGSLVTDAEARRLGGGSSFGMQRSTISPRPTAPSQVAPRAPAAAPGAMPPAAPQPRSGMWGMLGGLAIGAGLGALLGHFGMGGMGGGLLTMLLLVGGVILIARMFAARGPQLQTAATGNAPASSSAYTSVAPQLPATAATIQNPTIPAGFDGDGFLRQCKLNFVRLQAANDAGNMEDIKTFSTPEFFAEIEVQYLERGKTRQQTDIMQLDAALLDVTSEPGRQVASVHFSGQLRETPNTNPEAFSEVWNLVKPNDSNWIVAGIQQA